MVRSGTTRNNPILTLNVQHALVDSDGRTGDDREMLLVTDLERLPNSRIVCF
jgi:hypothetical protein